MNLSDDDFKEFLAEALELLDHAEAALLKLEAGADFSSEYDILFRSYHNLKGASGMLGLLKLQAHIHGMETALLSQKGSLKLDRACIDLLLRGQDAAKRILASEEISFSFESVEVKKSQSVAPPMPENLKQVAGAIHTAKPIKAKPITAKPITAKPITPKPVTGPLERVLVLDDDADMVQLLLSILTAEGIACHGITDSRLALQSIQTFKPTVVFSDIDMPYLDGIAVLKQVKKEYSRLPVVFVSGRIDKAVLMHAIHHGVFSVIEKPFDLNEVLQAVRNASRQNHLSNLAHSSLSLILYQFSDLDAFLQTKGDDRIRKIIRDELALLLDLQKKLIS